MRRAVVIGIVLLLWPLMSHAAIRWVSKQGSNGNSCGAIVSPTQPANLATGSRLTINSALTCMQAGDTLRVLAGTYAETDVNARPNGSVSAYTTVQGNGMGQTIIQGNMGFQEGSRWVAIQDLTINGNQTSFIASWTGTGNPIRFQRVEVTGAQHSGILGDCTNCEFLELDVHHNGTGSGSVCLDSDLSNHLPSQCHGLYMAGSGNIIEGGAYRDNEGAGLHLYGSCTNCTLRNTRIFGNGHSGLKTIFSGLIHNNLIYRNGDEGLMIYSGAASVYNNTLYGQTGPAIYFRDGAPTAIQNNVILDNASGIVTDVAGGTKSTNLCNSNQQSNGCDHVGTAANTVVSAPGNDFRLKTGSPAIDAGTNLAGLFTTDIEGNTRDANFDVGAYEFTGDLEPPEPEQLQAKYTFEAGSGLTVADSDTSFADNSGTFNTAGWSSDAAIGAFSGSFNGSRCVTISNVGGLSPAQYFTISAWLKPGAVDTEGAEIFSRGDSFLGRINPDGSPQVYWYDGSTWHSLAAVGIDLRNSTQWQSVSFMKDPTHLRIWRGTAQVASVPSTGTISYTLGADAKIGCHGNGGTTNDYSGLIDQVYVFNVYTDQTGIENIVNERVPAGNLSQTHLAWEAPNTTPPTTAGQLLGMDAPRTQLITQPAGVRVRITNNTGVEITRHFHLAVCDVALSGCDQDADWVRITNTINAVGVRIGIDSAVNMGDMTTLLYPLGGLISTPGRYVADTINTASKTTLPHGGVTEWVYRPILFGSPLTNGSQVRFRVLDEDQTPLDSYSTSPTLTLETPIPTSVRIGGVMVGGRQ